MTPQKNDPCEKTFRAPTADMPVPTPPRYRWAKWIVCSFALLVVASLAARWIRYQHWESELEEEFEVIQTLCKGFDHRDTTAETDGSLLFELESLPENYSWMFESNELINAIKRPDGVPTSVWDDIKKVQSLTELNAGSWENVTQPGLVYKNASSLADDAVRHAGVLWRNGHSGDAFRLAVSLLRLSELIGEADGHAWAVLACSEVLERAASEIIQHIYADLKLKTDTGTVWPDEVTEQSLREAIIILQDDERLLKYLVRDLHHRAKTSRSDWQKLRDRKPVGPIGINSNVNAYCYSILWVFRPHYSKRYWSRLNRIRKTLEFHLRQDLPVARFTPMLDRMTVQAETEFPPSDPILSWFDWQERFTSTTHKRYIAVHCRRRLAATALAIKFYSFEHGRFPDSLDQLVPAYLKEVSMDPGSTEAESIFYSRDGLPLDLKIEPPHWLKNRANDKPLTFERAMDWSRPKLSVILSAESVPCLVSVASMPGNSHRNVLVVLRDFVALEGPGSRYIAPFLLQVPDVLNSRKEAAIRKILVQTGGL